MRQVLLRSSVAEIWASVKQNVSLIWTSTCPSERNGSGTLQNPTSSSSSQWRSGGIFFRGKKGSLYSITERRVNPELIPVLGSQPAGDVNHKPGGRLPLLSARPAVTLATLKRAAVSFAVW